MPNVIEFEPRRNDDDYRREVEELLRHNYCAFEFQKVDGTIRDMKCTLKVDDLPEEFTSSETSNSKPGLLVVWDIEKEGFRSLRYDSVIKFRSLGPTPTPKEQVSTFTEDKS